MSSPLRENALLARFAGIGRDLPADVRVGPGDDLAVLGGVHAKNASGDGLLVGADQVVVGRHVRLDEDPFAIGRKAILRNLSDVAAMASRPLATIATATLDPTRDEDWAARLHAGLHETALAWHAPLVGGDLATHRVEGGPTVVSVTILAVPALPDGRVVTRAGAVAGDLLAVTGRLGGSLGPDGRGRHLDFEPRIDAAIGLAQALGPDLVCMMDLSDGLAKDAARLMRMADAAALVEAGSLPSHEGCDWRAAVGDGEDYELLFACRRTPPASVAGVPVTVIGRVIDVDGDDEAGAVWLTGHHGGAAPRERIDHLGWEHRGGGDGI